MDIERALRNMDRYTREQVKELLAEYKQTGNRDTFYKILDLLEEYDDPDVKELVKTLRR